MGPARQLRQRQRALGERLEDENAAAPAPDQSLDDGGRGIDPVAREAGRATDG